VARLDSAALEHGDVVAVALPPGPDWLDLVREIWDAGAALLPVDHRLPEPETRALLRRARPTVTLSPDGWERRADGVAAEADVALVVSTSGTGGEPKLVQFDRAAIDAAVAASALALEATPHDRWLCCLPLAHVGGLLVLLRGVLLGAPVTVHPGFATADVAAERGLAFTSVVPTMLVRLLDAGVDLSGFRAILVGGAHLPLDARERARAAGARLVETYGLTESCGGVVYEGTPLPGVRVRIDAEGGIELSGRMLMLGYRFDAQATALAFTPDGWLRPGDAGEIGPDGRLHVIGRVDDLINSGGEKVWPQEVEAALRTHPKVSEVLVRGRQDPEWGHRVVAWIVAADPADPPTLDELRAHAARRIPRHKAPREVVLMDALPRTGAGKPRTAGLPDRE
jgi:O-succinylbenzoic acid--CoA ligase